MSAPTSYVLGYTGQERRRLALQATILNPLTREFLLRAGLAPGMRVLDLGCGVGDVTFLAAEIVGEQGHVTGLDRDGQALALARAARAESRWTHVDFEERPIAEHCPPHPYDAIIGRHILIHTPNPALIVQQAAAQVRSGGIVAFQEYDLSHASPSTPAKPLADKVSRLLVEFFTRVTHADIGLRLFPLFQEAGLVKIQSRGEFLVDGGANSPFYEWAAETVRSLLPQLEATGLATRDELEVDTLAERFKEESLRVGGVLTSTALIGTSGSKP